jgi:hypothetical protein
MPSPRTAFATLTPSPGGSVPAGADGRRRRAGAGHRADMPVTLPAADSLAGSITRSPRSRASTRPYPGHSRHAPLAVNTPMPRSLPPSVIPGFCTTQPLQVPAASESRTCVSDTPRRLVSSRTMGRSRPTSRREDRTATGGLSAVGPILLRDRDRATILCRGLNR